MIDKYTYWRKWCPFCSSPRLESVALLSLAECTRHNRAIREEVVPGPITKISVQCENCKRVFRQDEVRAGYDRKAMRRDYITLGKLLAGKGGGE